MQISFSTITLCLLATASAVPMISTKRSTNLETRANGASTAGNIVGQVANGLKGVPIAGAIVGQVAAGLKAGGKAKGAAAGADAAAGGAAAGGATKAAKGN